MPHRLRERTQQFHYQKAKQQWHPITDACINVPLWYRQHLVPACAITACDLVLERWPYREDDRLYFDLPSVRVFAGVSDSINDANGVLIGTKSGKFAHWREYFNDLYNRPDPLGYDHAFDGASTSTASPSIDTTAPTIDEVWKAIAKLKVWTCVPNGRFPPAETAYVQNVRLVGAVLLMHQGSNGRTRSLLTGRIISPDAFTDSLVAAAGMTSECGAWRGLWFNITGIS